ncbi:MAG: ABC transporter permease [Bacteroides sp.]|nr:ABC transporter permease [Bacteroides sp.]MCM1447338.1 ABC transporter permease [Bacteroides sp.]MCM1515826.1 ABC transporter permease [Paraprevotella sp.]
MSYLNLFKVAMRAILSNKFRSFLSMLGIIIGVAAVIIMMAIGQGSKENVKAEMSKMGTNLLTIRPGADQRRAGVRPDPSSMQTLKEEDVAAIRREATLITKISPEVTSSGQVIYGNKNTSATLYGESPDYLEIKKWELQIGDCFTEEDCHKNSKVCVVGTTVVEELFGDKNYNCIGKIIRFKNIPLRVIGILKSKGYNSWGMDQDNLLIAPNSTVMKRVAAQTWYNSISASAVSEEMSEAAIEELKEILRRSHKLGSDDEDNFQVFSQQEMMETMSSTMDGITLILVVAAAFSLLVAGIGIMNIMLVSVTERTKEIGLRMSVGASGMDIMMQFLIESIMISLTGAFIGVALGYGASFAAKAWLMLPCQVPFWSVWLSFAVCVFIGIFFGYLPARKAARMDPIEAIRYE